MPPPAHVRSGSPIGTSPAGDGRTTVLVTGFGPFPSVPVNATMLLVPKLMIAAVRAFPSIHIVGEILATEWETAPRRVDQLIETHRPDLVLHFGVSARARGFEVETRGRNQCAFAPDAAGLMPAAAAVRSDGPELQLSRIPVAEIVRRLRRRGLPAFQSWDAGSYLCNATLYHVLASTEGQVSQAGFIHIPSSLAPPATKVSLSHRSRTSPGCPLTWPQTIRGALEILATCLDLPGPAARAAPVSRRS